MSVSHHYLTALSLQFNKLGDVPTEVLEKLAKKLRQKDLKKGKKLIDSGQYAKDLHFIGRGAVIGYVSSPEGKDYIKTIFLEGDFPSAQVSLLEGSPSYIVLETIEDSTILSINYKEFRKLMEEYTPLKDFYISYLEKSWVIEREKREVSIVMESAQERYQAFINKHPKIEGRIKKKYIAAHLGITPTQLSRIRKKNI